MLSAALLLSGAPPPGTSAQVTQANRGFVGLIPLYPGYRLVGQVGSLIGPPGNPTGMFVQLGNDTVVVSFGPRSTPQPMSAEAEIEGLVTKDYISAYVRWTRGAWTAPRVQFDVQPFGRLRTLTGTIAWVAVGGRRFRLRLPATGAVRVLTTVRQSRYELDGKPVSAPLPLSRGQAVQVLTVKGEVSLVAADINVRTVPASKPVPAR